MFARECVIRVEKKNVEYLIELHRGLCEAIESKNWELVEYCTNNLDEYMKISIVGVNVMETE